MVDEGNQTHENATFDDLGENFEITKTGDGDNNEVIVVGDPEKIVKPANQGEEGNEGGEQGSEVNTQGELQNQGEQGTQDGEQNQEEQGQEGSEEGGEQGEQGQEGEEGQHGSEGEEAHEGGEEGEVSEEEYFIDLSESTGFEINSDEDIHNALLELRDLREQESVDPFEGMPKELQMAFEVHKSGGDYMTALSAISKDYDGMNDKEVLREKYFQDNKELVAGDKDLASMKFEREFAAKYGVINKADEFDEEDEKAEWIDNNKENVAFATKELEHDVKTARTAMNQFKTDSTTPQSEIPGLTVEQEEEMQATIEKHNEDALNTFNEHEGIVLSINDNDEDDFHLQIPEESREMLHETLMNPVPYFKEVLGMDLENGVVSDHNKLADVITYLEMSKGLGPKLGQYYLEKMDKASIDTLLEQGITKKTPDNKDSETQDPMLEAARIMGNRDNAA